MGQEEMREEDRRERAKRGENREETGRGRPRVDSQPHVRNPIKYHGPNFPAGK